MVSIANQFVLFDVRLFDIPPADPLFDNEIYNAEYGGMTTPLIYSSYHPIVDFINSLDYVKRLEYCAYASTPDPHSTYKASNLDNMPDPYIFSFLLEISSEQTVDTSVYSQLPIALRK